MIAALKQLRLRPFDGKIGRVAALLLCALALVSAAQGCRNALMPWGSIDLGMSLKAAQHLQHVNPYERHLASPDRFSRAPTGARNPFPMMPMQVPSALMLLWPFGALSWPAAKLAWLLSNLAFTAGLLLLAFRRFLPGRSGWKYLAVTSLVLISLPWRIIVGNGQHLLAALFFFLLAIDLADRRRPIPAGLAVAVCLVKYSITLWLLPWFVLRRQWTPLLLGLAIHAAMTLGIALWLGSNPVTLLTQALRAGSGTLQGAGYLDLFAIARSVGAPDLAAALAALSLFGLILWSALKRTHSNPDLFLAAACLVSTVVVYHRSYDLLVLLLPLLIVMRDPAGRPLLAGLLAATLLLTWYVDKAVLELTSWLDADDTGTRGGAYFYLLAALLYSTLAASIHALLTGSPPGGPGAHGRHGTWSRTA
jgi:hypothetical protein